VINARREQVLIHPEFRQAAIDAQRRTLDRPRYQATARADREQRPGETDEPVVLRLCTVHDDEALGRLARLEGRPAPRGRFVVAEVDGSVVAALPVGPGAPLADPFRRTAHLLPLLALRSEQVSPGSTRRTRPVGKRVWSWGRA
jgi:hypothetical protein